MHRDSADTGEKMSEIDVRPLVHAEIVRDDDGPDECTLYPKTVASNDERMSAWITACGDGFVDLSEMQ